MSLVKTKAIQMGFDATPTNNFLIYQPLTPDGTFRIANGNQGATTDIMTVTSGGSVTFAGTTNFSSLNFGAGSESAPSLFPTGDSNTGIWFPAADTFAVSTGGTERIRVAAGGNVGIGTNTPASTSKLHVVGSNQTPLYSGQIFVATSDAAAIDVGGQLSFGGKFDATQSTQWAAIAGRKSTATSGEFGGYLQLSTRPVGGNTTERVRISSNGYFAHYGPDSSWYSNATANNTRLDIIPVNGGVTYRAYSSGTDGTPAHIWNIQGTERMRIDSTGRVAIGNGGAIRSDVGAGTPRMLVEGTNFNQSGLALVSNNNASAGDEANIILAKSRGTAVNGIAAVTSSDILGSIFWAGADGADINQYAALIKGEVDGTVASNSVPGRIVFSTTAASGTTVSERMRINSAGVVSIASGGRLTIDSGSNSPIIDLTTSVNAWATRGIRMLAPSMTAGNGSALMYSVGQSDTAKNMGQMYFYYTGAASNSNRLSFGLHSVDDVLNIMANGNVGIGNVSPSAKLHVTGGIIGTTVATGDLIMSNMEQDPNEVDGTHGHWCLQEGEDNLYLINRRNGKKYKFNITEVV